MDTQQLASGLIGHEGAREMLRRLCRRRRDGSFLLAGPAGIGKFQVATWFANSLCCESGGDSPCGRCATCGQLDRGTYPFREVIQRTKGEKEIPVASVRQVLERLSLRLPPGKRRVILIRDAETLSRAAQAALLKALEETPCGVSFVLTCFHTQALHPTVVSRCMRIRLGPLTRAQFERVLRWHSEVAPSHFGALWRLAPGSPGRALAPGSRKRAEHEEQLIPRILEEAREAPAACSDRLARFARSQGKLPEAHRQAAIRMLEQLAWAVQQAWRRGESSAPPEGSDAWERAVHRLAHAMDWQELLRVAEGILRAQRALLHNANLALAMDAAMLGFHAASAGGREAQA